MMLSKPCRRLLLLGQVVNALQLAPCSDFQAAEVSFGASTEPAFAVQVLTTFLKPKARPKSVSGISSHRTSQGGPCSVSSCSHLPA